MPSLQLFVLCHNRPADTRQVLRSVLQQTDTDFQLLVSDNSSTDEVQALVQAEFPQVPYIRRTPMLPALEHFNQCIAEASSDYFCLFHDDDLMDPDFVAGMKQAAKEAPEAVAIACNARIERFGKIEAKLSFQSATAREAIGSAENLAARYFSRAQSGIAPFPGYVYHTRKVADSRIPQDGGKYSDVTWLLSLARKAPVVWLSQPLMTYRMHGGNDGNTESRRDRLRFLAFLKRNTGWLGTEILQDYRTSFIYKTLLREAGPQQNRRREIARAYVGHYRWARYGRLSTYRALIQRARVKWNHN